LNQFRKTRLLVKELGILNLLAYARYRLQASSGSLEKRFPAGDTRFSQVSPQVDLTKIKGVFLDWDSVLNQDIDPLFIDRPLALLNGQYKPFGGDPDRLTLSLSDTHLDHWICYDNEFAETDIKLTWEPARFTWVYPLIHAWKVTRGEKYPETFWKHAEEFLKSNPVNVGPNWSSAQEMALRTIAWLFALEGFKNAAASNPQRMQALLEVILLQVDRIPVTLHYARAQHNNHLLSEALALMLAGDALQGVYPQAARWAELGEREFIRGILDQVEPDGTYSQHSTNYHRLMLQLALLFNRRMEKQGKTIPPVARQRLAAATRWAVAQMDPVSGRLPNLGHNDGALLLPIGADDFRDYRPTLQAAALAFLGQPALPPGKWDLLSMLLGLTSSGGEILDKVDSPAVLKVGSGESWATLRAARFHGRPAHADQLHVDIWWRGKNISRDPGTYLYNGAEPWTNPLDRTCFHNTVTVDHRDQMERVSRFLWLDQAQAKVLRNLPTECIASHDGYRKIGVLHTRTLTSRDAEGFTVIDRMEVVPGKRQLRHYTIHWLLPDWKWQIDAAALKLNHNDLETQVKVDAAIPSENRALLPISISLLRGGETLCGEFDSPIHGWESNTYAFKLPALSFLIKFESSQSVEIRTQWEFHHA
jgi:hypothetical protein